jgi:hypothetical protein
MSHGDLEIDEDIEFQRRMWKFQRVGWLFLALAIMASLFGAFGHGPLSHTTAKSQGSPTVWLEYERFERYDTPSILRLHLGAQVGENGNVGIHFSHHYLSSVHIQEITPAPVRSEATSDGATFLIRLAEPNQPW